MSSAPRKMLIRSGLQQCYDNFLYVFRGSCVRPVASGCG
jgi:hypothetical protein